MVKLQDDAAKNLTKNGNYPSPNHPEEHFIPEGTLFAFHISCCLNVMKAVVMLKNAHLLNTFEFDSRSNLLATLVGAQTLYSQGDFMGDKHDSMYSVTG